MDKADKTRKRETFADFIRYQPADAKKGETPSRAQRIDPNQDGILTDKEFGQNCAVFYDETASPAPCSTPFSEFRAAAMDEEPNASGAPNPLTHPYFKDAKDQPDIQTNLLRIADSIVAAARNSSAASANLKIRKLAEACLIFEQAGLHEKANECFYSIISLASKEPGMENECAYYRAMLALSRKDITSLRKYADKLPDGYPGARELKDLAAGMEDAERRVETWQMAAAIAEAHKAEIFQMGMSLKSHLGEAVGLYDREARRRDIGYLDAFIKAWKDELETKPQASTAEILAGIWRGANKDAARGLFLMQTLKSPDDKKAFENFDIENELGLNEMLLSAPITGSSDHVKLYDLVAIEGDSRTRAETFKDMLYFVSAQAGSEGKAALAAIAQAMERSRTLGDTAGGFLRSEVANPGAFVLAREAVKGFTDPVAMTVMVGGFALARLTTAAIMGRFAPAAVSTLGTAGRIAYGASELTIEAGAFTVYGRILEELLTTRDVRWSPKEMTKDWAGLAIRFACARIFAIPLLGINRAMGLSKRFGTGKIGINAAGEIAGELSALGAGTFAVVNNLGSTFGFYAGGHISHELGLSDRAGSFVEEEILLLQFQLGTYAAGKLSGNIVNKTAQRLKSAKIDLISKIAEKLADGRESQMWELIARRLILAEAKGKLSAGKMQTARRALEGGKSDLKSILAVNEVLAAADLPLEYDGTLKITDPETLKERDKEQTAGRLSQDLEKMLGIKPRGKPKKQEGPPRLQFISGEEGLSIEQWTNNEAELTDGAKLVIRDNGAHIRAPQGGAKMRINGEDIPAGGEVPLVKGDRIKIGERQFDLLEGGNAIAENAGQIEIDPNNIPASRIITKDMVRGDVAELTIGSQGTLPKFLGAPQIRIESAGGEVFLVDERPGSAEKDVSSETVNEFYTIEVSGDAAVLSVNGKQAPRGRTRLKSGDEITLFTRNAAVHIPGETSVPEIARLPKWQQRILASKIAGAREFAGLERALAETSGADTARLAEAIQLVASGKATLLSLPVELGIRAKVRALIEEKAASSDLVLAKAEEGSFRSENEFGAMLDPVEYDYRKLLAIEKLRQDIKSARDLNDMARIISESPFWKIESTEAKELASKLREAAATGEAGTGWLPKAAGIMEKAAEFIGGDTATFRTEIRAARDIGDIIAILEGSGLKTIEGKPIEAVIVNLGEIAGERGNGIHDLPKAGGLRQKARDIVEQRDMRRAMEGSQHRENALRALKPRERKLHDSIEAARKSIKAGLDEATAEKVDQVLDRGRPIELLTRNDNLRRQVEANVMKPTIAAARELYPGDVTNVEVNPYSGERVTDSIETRYRLARNVLNDRAKLPLRGLPARSEAMDLVRLVNEHTGAKATDYMSAQAALRRAIDTLSPEAYELLRNASTAEKPLILETYFGNYSNRDMPDSKTAFRVATLLGLSGMYREVGVNYTPFMGKLYASVSLGDLGSVHYEKGDGFRIGVMHTHPEEYVNERGRIMGAKRRRNPEAETMYLGDDAEKSRDSRNILPSETDIKTAIAHAEQWAVSLVSKDFGDTPFYDSARKIYKHWVIHPFGGSQINIYLKDGKAKLVVIYFHINKSAKDIDHNYGNVRNDLLRFIDDKLGLEPTITAIPTEKFSERLPFPISDAENLALSADPFRGER